MNMHDAALKEIKEIEKNIAAQNRKLAALRMVIREYTTQEQPSTERLQMIVTECLRKNNGCATFAQIAEYIEDHQIALLRHKLSSLLNLHPGIEYAAEEKKWKIVLTLPNSKE